MIRNIITYRDEFKERLLPLERIVLAEYKETGKLVIWLDGDEEVLVIKGDEAARVWAEIKSKKQKTEIAAQINLEHLRDFFADVAFVADALYAHVKGNEELRGALADLKQSAIQMADELSEFI